MVARPYKRCVLRGLLQPRAEGGDVCQAGEYVTDAAAAAAAARRGAKAGGGASVQRMDSKQRTVLVRSSLPVCCGSGEAVNLEAAAAGLRTVGLSSPARS